MSLERPDGYANPTAMTHHGPDLAVAEPRPAFEPDLAAQAAAADEQEAKRVEKIRSHASSHHTAGTVSLDP